MKHVNRHCRSIGHIRQQLSTVVCIAIDEQGNEEIHISNSNQIDIPTITQDMPFNKSIPTNKFITRY